jgi:predicted RNase H-like HicB family nuclease
VKYPCIVEAGEDGEDGFSVSFPDLPGCFTQGESLEDAFRQARLAAESWLEATDEDGTPWPAASPQVTASEGEIVLWIEVAEPLRQAA